MRVVVAFAIAGCASSSVRPAVSPPTALTAPDSDAPATEPKHRESPEAAGARVLLAITGLSASTDGMTSADLARDYCAGKVIAIDGVEAAADKQFDCHIDATTTLADFARHARTKIAITDLDHITPQFKALDIDGVSFFTKPAEYPLVTGEPRPDYAPHLTHFIMTGVTAITRAMGVACEQHGVDWLTANIRDEFKHADYVHVSNEVSFKPGCTYAGATYAFCSREGDFKALLDLHVNVVELTGNHNRDFGDEPFKKTFAWYGKHDIKTFGAGLTPEGANQPIVLDLADGKHLGIVGFNESCPLKECAKRADEVGANAYDAAKAKADIAQMREDGADFIIVTVQFREWDHAEPTKSQSQISHELIDDGADLVYGSQAHEPQVVEFYKGKPIFHGIGNLLFDQIHRLPVRQAFFLHHYFFHGKLVQSVPVFTLMSMDRQPTLATPAQAAEMKKVIYRDNLIYR